MKRHRSIVKKDPTADLTLDQIKGCVPIGMRNQVSQKMLDVVNAKIDDSGLKAEYRENLLDWASVLQQGKWSLEDFANAVKFVTNRLIGDTVMMSWAKVFPERYQRLVDKNTPRKTISSHSTLFARGKLVVALMERSLVPVYITNSDILQEAINVQATLMRTAKSETVMQKASATLIENLQVPEALKVQVDVGVSNDTVDDLRSITRALAVEQQKMIESGGMTAKEIAEMPVVKKAEPVIEAEYEEMEIDHVSRLNPLKGFFPGSK